MIQCPNCGKKVGTLEECDCMIFKEGEIVLDDLTLERHKVISITKDYIDSVRTYVECYKIDSDWVDGWRYGWELTKWKKEWNEDTLRKFRESVADWHELNGIDEVDYD